MTFESLGELSWPYSHLFLLVPKTMHFSQILQNHGNKLQGRWVCFFFELEGTFGTIRVAIVRASQQHIAHLIDLMGKRVCYSL